MIMNEKAEKIEPAGKYSIYTALPRELSGGRARSGRKGAHNLWGRSLAS